MKNIGLFKQFLMAFLGIILLMSCMTEPEAINYGKENCQFCKMTIMDNKYGSELVTQKGKIFKFDDVSCMIKYINISEQTPKDYAHIVVNSYDKPVNLIDANKAFFVISPNFASPMMGNTAAFSDEKQADEAVKKDSEAKKYSWNELVKKF
ncbi:nitrous oxide reductase accessory protein NosL [Emticicia sp. SJ17W-69]|uniref:nitrous oxide reductase accessory protein NosL n=1 Tax=Emticicia sp. SJ17W-69 TaxID=3421657 RepID=UPI003EBA0EC4